MRTAAYHAYVRLLAVVLGRMVEVEVLRTAGSDDIGIWEATLYVTVKMRRPWIRTAFPSIRTIPQDTMFFRVAVSIHMAEAIGHKYLVRPLPTLIKTDGRNIWVLARYNDPPRPQES